MFVWRKTRRTHIHSHAPEGNTNTKSTQVDIPTFCRSIWEFTHILTRTRTRFTYTHMLGRRVCLCICVRVEYLNKCRRDGTEA